MCNCGHTPEQHEVNGRPCGFLGTPGFLRAGRPGTLYLSYCKKLKCHCEVYMPIEETTTTAVAIPRAPHLFLIIAKRNSRVTRYALTRFAEVLKRETMKFRKKPVIIEAERTDKRVVIETLEGTMVAEPGDWIITGIHGERYPCKPDIFSKTYEPTE